MGRPAGLPNSAPSFIWYAVARLRSSAIDWTRTPAAAARFIAERSVVSAATSSSDATSNSAAPGSDGRE